MKALVIIDVQNDYFEGGAMELVHPNKALDNILILKEYFTAKKLPIIYIQHINQQPAPFFNKDSKGVQIHHALLPNGTLRENEYLVEKAYPSSFQGTNLETLLKDLSVDSLLITGMMTHMCVDTTTRAAFERGYNISLASDCVAAPNLTFNDIIVSAADVEVAYLSALQRFGIVASSKELIETM